MAKAAICFSTHDAAFAEELANYLALHASVVPELAACDDPADFLDTIEQCLTCEIVLVVLSLAALPKMWPRPEWERVLIECVRESGAHIAYLQREACPFPQILKRRAFFSSPAEVRQWAIHVLNPDRPAPALCPGEPDDSLQTLLDNPGLRSGVKQAAANSFVSSYWRFFENVYRVECGSATRSGVLGELAHAIGLRLPGTVDQNREALLHRATHERALYIFENLPEEFSELADLGGKASVIILENQGHRQPVTLAQLKETFFTPGANEALCLRLLGRFISSEQQPDHWPDIKAIGFRARLFFRKRCVRRRRTNFSSGSPPRPSETVMPAPWNNCSGKKTGFWSPGICRPSSAPKLSGLSPASSRFIQRYKPASFSPSTCQS